MTIGRTIMVLALPAFLMCSGVMSAQTASSLFWKKDGRQVGEIFSETGNEYNTVGHHGPAVENTHFALRLYFNDSGAIDVYSKCGRGMELEHYGWYPDSVSIADFGAGCDEYVVGSTLGLGGIALWDGNAEVRLRATGGRSARVGDTSKGSFAEMVAYGVPYAGDTVDIMIRIDVYRKTRVAKVTARELSGKKVRFITGVNYHEGEQVNYGEGYISVWGVHPSDVSQSPVPVGAGMFYQKGQFETVDKTEDMVRIISKPASQIVTSIVAASTMEAELNTARRFEAFMMK